MLYRIIGEEVSTHRRVEIPNWKLRPPQWRRSLAAEIGVKVLHIESMKAKREQRERREESINASDLDDNLARGCLRATPSRSPSSKCTGPQPTSLINCPACRKPVSEAASSCPSCGFPAHCEVVATQKAIKQKAEQVSVGFVLGGAGVFLVLFFLCSGVSTSQQSSSPAVDTTTVANKVARVDRHSDNPEYELRRATCSHGWQRSTTQHRRTSQIKPASSRTSLRKMGPTRR